jgi:hypothetical protein
MASTVVTARIRTLNRSPSIIGSMGTVCCFRCDSMRRTTRSGVVVALKSFFNPYCGVIRNDKVWHRNKWVRTKSFEYEASIGRGWFYSIADFSSAWLLPSMLYETVREKIFGGVNAYNKVASNTSIIFHDRRLLALVENAAPHWVSWRHTNWVSIFYVSNKGERVDARLLRRVRLQRPVGIWSRSVHSASKDRPTDGRDADIRLSHELREVHQLLSRLSRRREVAERRSRAHRQSRRRKQKKYG